MATMAFNFTGVSGMGRLRLCLEPWEESRRTGAGNLTNGELVTNGVGAGPQARKRSPGPM